MRTGYQPTGKGFLLSGTKRFIIVPPEDDSCCYRMNWHCSPIDAENPDYRKYPLYSDARAHSGAGDLWRGIAFSFRGHGTL